MIAASPAKTYDILFEHRPEYLYVHVKSDKMSYNAARQYWIEILDMMHRRKYERIMVDKEIAEALPIHDVFSLVSELAHSGCSGVRFGICDRYYDPERSCFEEMVGTNRGLKVRILDDPQQTETWLLGH